MSDCATPDYFTRVSPCERDVLRAVTSGTREGLSADVAAITRAVLDMPCANRGLAVANVLIEPEGESFSVLVELRDGTSCALVVRKPTPKED
jgi:hypothetical protein